MPETGTKKKLALNQYLLSYHDELVERIGWLIRVRWLAGLGVSSTIIITTALFDLLIDRNFLLLLSLSIYFFNTLYVLYFRRLLARPDRPNWHQRVALFANIQISIDLVILTVLIYASGGVENPFFFYFIFHMVIASILLSTLASYLQATLAVALFNLMLVLEHLRVIPHHPLFTFFTLSIYGHPVFMLGISAVFTTTIYLTVYMASSITGRLRTRERELIEVKDSLEKINRELRLVHEHRSRFILKVEHELKAPLAAIQSLIAVILTSFNRDLTPKVAELLQRTEKRTQNLLEMIRELLDLSRMQTADYHFQSEPLDLPVIITRQLEILRTQAEDKSLTLAKKFPPDLPKITGDPRAIEQVFMNLLSNAVKYTETGGIVVEASVNGEFVGVSVEDTGIGMTKEELNNIFEEFYRGAIAKEKYEGTGLGLSIVYEIVDCHGGIIEVESSPGKGSKFTVFLPKDKGQSPIG